jgi:hypothetical protein
MQLLICQYTVQDRIWYIWIHETQLLFIIMLKLVYKKLVDFPEKGTYMSIWTNTVKPCRSVPI